VRVTCHANCGRHVRGVSSSLFEKCDANVCQGKQSTHTLLRPTSGEGRTESASLPQTHFQEAAEI